MLGDGRNGWPEITIQRGYQQTQQPIGRWAYPVLSALPFRDLSLVRMEIHRELVPAKPEVLSEEAQLLTGESRRIACDERLSDCVVYFLDSRDCDFGVPA